MGLEGRECEKTVGRQVGKDSVKILNGNNEIQQRAAKVEIWLDTFLSYSSVYCIFYHSWVADRI